MILKSFNEKINFIAILTIVLLGAVVYFNSLNNEFLWDDNQLIVENQYITNWNKIPAIFTKDIGAGCENFYGDNNSFYRPLQIVTYSIDYQFWRLHATGYHITNIVLHILTGCVIFWLVSILFNDKPLALLTSLLFIVHPVHGEAVAYISGRATLMAALFMLLASSLYVSCKSKENYLLYGFSLASYLLALLSKEVAILFPLLLILYDYTCGRLNKNSLRRIIPFCLIALLFIILRLTVFKFSVETLRGSNIALPYRLSAFFKSIGAYVKLLLFPINQHMGYGIVKLSFSDFSVLTGFGIMAVLLSIAVWAKDKYRIIFFSVLWFFINLLPFSGFCALNTFMAEGWLYIPSIGYFLLIAYLFRMGIEKHRDFKAVILICFACVLGFYAEKAIAHNEYWKDAPAFFNKTLEYVSDEEKPEMYFNLGVYYNKRNLRAEAVAMYQKVIALSQKTKNININYCCAYNNLGNIYWRDGLYSEASECYNKAIAIKQDWALPYLNLALTYHYMNKQNEASMILRKIEKLYPHANKEIEAIHNIIDSETQH